MTLPKSHIVVDGYFYKRVVSEPAAPTVRSVEATVWLETDFSIAANENAETQSVKKFSNKAVFMDHMSSLWDAHLTNVAVHKE